jgi:hypothetical protein
MSLRRNVVGVVQRRHRDGRAPPTKRPVRARRTASPAPVRPDVDGRSLAGLVVFCSAGNLKATAQRGNLLVVPSLRRLSSASTLMTTPSVSKPRRASLLGPLSAERDERVDPRASSSNAARRKPHRFSCSSVSHGCDAAEAL